MSNVKLLTLIMINLLASFLGIKGQSVKKNFIDDKFSAGQIWKYHTLPNNENSTLIILKVENIDKHVIVHISVEGLKIKNHNSESGITERIGHLPFSKEALLNSVTELISENNSLPAFEEGYEMWKASFKNNQAGIFTVPVSEAVNFVEESLNPR